MTDMFLNLEEIKELAQLIDFLEGLKQIHVGEFDLFDSNGTRIGKIRPEQIGDVRFSYQEQVDASSSEHS